MPMPPLLLQLGPVHTQAYANVGICGCALIHELDTQGIC